MYSGRRARNGEASGTSRRLSRQLIACCALLVALFASTAIREQAHAQGDVQQNVIVVVMDGVRYTETFGDPRHANIPKIWGALRPVGTIYTSFYNRGQTVTAGGHGSLLSGNDHWLDQGSVAPPYPEWAMPRTYTPTLFEYYRAATGAPQSSVWLIANHVAFLQGLAYSVHPAYGANYAASWLLGPGSDAKMMSQVSDIMDQHHPNFMLIDLHQTDKVAHADDYLAYLYHIRLDDWLVCQLWQKINRSAFYRGRTTLIVTNDHGRHTDDWTNHGDCCDGCQHIMLLALGPNIRQGYVGTGERHLSDLGPTIAAILGVPAPYAVSSVMQEMFVSPPGAGTDPPSASPAESLALRVITLDEHLVPKTVFAPGETAILMTFARNTGSIPAAMYQSTTAWTACRVGIAGTPYDDNPLHLGAGETGIRFSRFQVPPAVPAGVLPITFKAEGLDDSGQLIEGTTIVDLTIQP